MIDRAGAPAGRRGIAAVLACVWLVAAAAFAADGNGTGTALEVTLERDTWGVPHVYGPTDASVVFGYLATYQLFVFNRAGIQPEEIAAHAGASLSAASFQHGTLAPVALSAVADANARAGSNTWALAPSRTGSGKAMLFINPHQPYFGPGQWYEGHVHSDEGLNFSGAGFFASPLPTIGHNERLGWSHTVNEPDIVDVYALTMTGAGRYRWGNGERNTISWSDSLQVKTDAGLETRTFRFERSHQGPIVAQRDGKPLAVRMAKFEDGGQLEQRYAMSRAQDLDAFKAALGQLASPMFNTMYADADGNIFYAYYGAAPRSRDRPVWGLRRQ